MPTRNGRGSSNITGRLPAALYTAFCAALLLAGCGRGAGPVDPADHDRFFLWAGVKPPPALDHAREVYILSGEVRAGDNGWIVPLRPQVPRVRHADIWLVLRVERLDWQKGVTDQLLRELARWEAAGNRLQGVQIDFDAATLGLESYARFLAGLRADLPARYRLSVTGLMDWSANGDPAALARLAGIVDEAVIQTYQGRTTIPGYEAYMASLARLDMPYKVALVEGGEWTPPAALAKDADFRGYVVFLLPPP